MKQERVILSFITVLIGLVVAGIAFYFYQSTKTVSTTQSDRLENPSPTPSEKSPIFLQVFEPKDEGIADRKTIKVSGKTVADATVVILTGETEEIIEPSREGDFTTTVQIDDGVNYIKIQAFLPTGETQTVQRIVAYTTEDF